MKPLAIFHVYLQSAKGFSDRMCLVRELMSESLLQDLFEYAEGVRREREAETGDRYTIVSVNLIQDVKAI